MSLRILREAALVTAVFIFATAAAPMPAQTPQSEQHIAWVTEALKRMQTIQPGMTRRQLLTVFTTEGGIASRLEQTFVSRDCPYFKLTVNFESVGGPSQDSDGRPTWLEGNEDRIVKISHPFLQFSILD